MYVFVEALLLALYHAKCASNNYITVKRVGNLTHLGYLNFSTRHQLENIWKSNHCLECKAGSGTPLYLMR